ncbi:hypothetical protein PC123_g17505 [Phytophthora cactorum]|nr:hypothetical protein PC123_g17505 [Phytophthora cactorum]
MWTARKKEGRRCGRRLRRKAKPITTPDLERPRYSRCPSSSLLWRFQVVRQLFAFRLSLVDDLEAAR